MPKDVSVLPPHRRTVGSRSQSRQEVEIKIGCISPLWTLASVLTSNTAETVGFESRSPDSESRA